MRECLIAFMGSVELDGTRQAELTRAVTEQSAAYGWPRRPRVQDVRITLGRPGFSAAFGPGK
jgi:hypothetical protein